MAHGSHWFSRTRSSLRLTRELTAREVRGRLSQSTVGFLWLVATPILLLAVYAFVFGVIFRARAPVDFDFPFVVWLALGLWPWLAFSEATLRGAQAIRQHGALISKISIDRSIIVSAVLSGTFLLHLVGYGIVLIVLELSGINLTWLGLPYALVILCTLYGLTLGLGWMLCAVQVFIRDLEQLLPILFMLWFFLTPILYAPDLLPVNLQPLLYVNPMTWWIEELRAALIEGQVLPDRSFLVLVAGSVLMLVIGRWVFDRLSPYFEDFL